MKTASDELFQLVHSLTPSEKRHYMLRAKRNASDRAHAKELIYTKTEKQRDYDEAAIKKLLNKKDHASFAAIKKELYEDIIEALRTYHAKRTPSSELNALIEHAFLLFHKGLFAASEKKLIRARKIASEYMMYARLLEINSLERSIYSEIASADFAEKLRQRSEEHKRLLAIMTNINDYTELYNKVLILIKKERVVRTPEQKQELEQLMRSPLMADESRALSLHARIIHLAAHMFNAFLNEDYDRAYQLSKRQLDTWETYPHLMEVSLTRYIQTVNNFMNICAKRNYYAEIPYYIGKLKKLKPSSDYIRGILLEQINSIEHGVALGTNKIELAKKLIVDGQELINAYGRTLNEVRILLFYLNGATTFFIAGEYEQTISYLEKALQHSQMELRADLQSFTRLLLLLVHYELRNSTLLQYIIRSTKRYLKSHAQNFTFEQVLIASLRRLSAARNRQEEHKELLKLKSQVLDLLGNPYEARALHSFDFLAWIESKLQEVPLSQLWGKTQPAGKAA